MKCDVPILIMEKACHLAIFDRKGIMWHDTGYGNWSEKQTPLTQHCDGEGP